MNFARHSRQAFTLIELMAVVLVIAAVITLLVPDFVRAKKSAQGSRCLLKIRDDTVPIFLYANDHKDLFPSFHVPRQWKYWRQNQILNHPNWSSYVGVAPTSIGRCPANNPRRYVLFEKDPDYVTSFAFYLKPEFLSAEDFPGWPPASNHPSDLEQFAQVQHISSVIFPGQKTILKELHVWHEYDGVLDYGTDYAALNRDITFPRRSVSFADGHAQFTKLYLSLAVIRQYHFPNGPMMTTYRGVRGIDIP